MTPRSIDDSRFLYKKIEYRRPFEGDKNEEVDYLIRFGAHSQDRILFGCTELQTIIIAMKLFKTKRSRGARDVSGVNEKAKVSRCKQRRSRKALSIEEQTNIKNECERDYSFQETDDTEQEIVGH